MVAAMKALLFALLLSMLPSCAGTCGAKCDTPAPGRVQHVVLMWLNEPGNSDARAQLIEASMGLRDIPGVLAVRVGEPLASDRDIVDDSFDVAIVMTLADAVALAAYESHPDHVAAVNEVLRPNVARFLVYDVVE